MAVNYTDFILPLSGPGAGKSGLEAENGITAYITVTSDGHLSVSGKRWRGAGFNISRDACKMSNANADSVAERLRAFGCNCVRLFGFDHDSEGITSVYPALDNSDTLLMEYLINALKQRGMYIDLALGAWDPNANLTDARSIFMPALISAQQTFIDNILTRTNIYTGLTWGADPAISFFEVLNEAGMLSDYFSDEFAGYAAGDITELESQWNTWLTAKYATTAALDAAWGTGASGTEGNSLGSITYIEYNAGVSSTNKYADKVTVCRKDWITFLVDTEKTYFTDMKAFLNARSGGLVIAGQVNYMANQSAAIGDIIDRHFYYDRPTRTNAGPPLTWTTSAANSVTFNDNNPLIDTIISVNRSFFDAGLVQGVQEKKVKFTGTVSNDGYHALSSVHSATELRLSSQVTPEVASAIAVTMQLPASWDQANIPWTGSSSTLGYIGNQIGSAQKGKPSIVTEFAYGGHNAFSAEGTLAFMALAAYQDWDAVFFFNYNNGSGTVYDDQYVAGDLRSDKNPTKMLTFALMAKAFKEGYIRPAIAEANETYTDQGEIDAIEGYTVNQANVRICNNAAGSGFDYHPTRCLQQRLYTTPDSATVDGGTAAAITLTPATSDTGELVYDATASAERFLIKAKQVKAFVGYVNGASGVDLGDGISIDPPISAGDDWFSFCMARRNGANKIQDGGTWLVSTMGRWRNQNMVYHDAAETDLAEWGNTSVQVDMQSMSLTLPVSFANVKAWPLNEDGARGAPLSIAHDGSGNAVILLSGISAWYEIEVKPRRRYRSAGGPAARFSRGVAPPVQQPPVLTFTASDTVNTLTLFADSLSATNTPDEYWLTGSATLPTSGTGHPASYYLAGGTGYTLAGYESAESVYAHARNSDGYATPVLVSVTAQDTTNPVAATLSAAATSTSNIRISVSAASSDAHSGVASRSLQRSDDGSTGWTQIALNPSYPYDDAQTVQKWYREVVTDNGGNAATSGVVTANPATFGTMSPVFNTEFSGYSVGTNFVTANATIWSVGSTQDNLVANDPLGQRGKVLMQRIPDNTVDFGCGASIPGLVNLTDGDEVWCRVWLLLPTGFAGDCHNPPIAGCSDTLKFIRFETGGLASNPSAKLDFNRPRLNYSNPVGGIIAVESVPTRSLDPGLPDPGDDIGIWTHHEVYAKLKADGTGRVRWWHNDVLRVDAPFQTFDQLGEVLNGSLFMLAYWNGGATDNASDGSYVGQTMYTTEWTVFTSANPPTNTDASGNLFIGSSYSHGVEKLV